MHYKVEFELVSPEKILISEPVDMVVVPGGEGNFGVLAGHIPAIATVRSGVIEMHDDNMLYDRIFVDGGFAEVFTIGEETRCTVLVESAIKVEDLVLADIEKDLKNLKEDLEDAKEEGEKALIEARLSVVRAKFVAATGEYPVI
ncbi:ATP synthase epsilon chain [Azospirillaceae bacterium]